MKIWNHATDEPWAITEAALSTIIAIATRQQDAPEALLTRSGRALKNAQVTQERDGVAIVPVTGPLFRYANIFTEICGASSYEILAKDFQAALDNPAIRGVVFDIDSPGGEVNGCAELARLIFDARGTKPIVAYASGYAASGAYWIASACDRIVVSDTALLGSIGVAAVYRGKSSQASDAIEIVSSQSPYKRLDPKTDEGRTRLQTRIDALADVFVEAVARHRGVDPPAVIKNYGAGDVFIGKHAVQNGLADALGTLERTIASITPNKSPVNERGSSFLGTEESNMDLKTLQAEHPQLAASLVTSGIEQGRQQERERIGAIVGADEAKGREQLARHLAFATDMPATAALATLNATPAVSTTATPAHPSGFDKAMSALGNPSIETASEDSSDDIDTLAKRIAGLSAGGAA